MLVNPYLEPGMKRYWVPSTASSALFGSDLADYVAARLAGTNNMDISEITKVVTQRAVR